LESVQVPAGQPVFRKGDPADRFYVIETGSADVVETVALLPSLVQATGLERSRCCAECRVPPRFWLPVTWNCRR
jgi:hypothetical protein